VHTSVKNFRQLDQNNDWWKQAVFYQIYPRSFADSNGDGIGDLQGIISSLDYLNDGTDNSLGIDAIWFSPFFTSPDHDFGYDIADYLDIDPRYGTLDDFDRLLDEAHKRKIRVILDLVVNHTSDRHPWFIESKSSRDNPKRDWYIWKDGRGGGRRPPNNWRNNFFGRAWTKDENSGQYYLHSFLKEQPDLNWDNPEVRSAVGDVIRFWLDKGVDGFRLDVAHIYSKDPQFRDNPSLIKGLNRVGGLKAGDRTMMANLMKKLSLPELQVRKYNQHIAETHSVLKEFRHIFDAYPAVTSVGEIVADDINLIASYYGDNLDELHMNFYFEILHCRWKAGAFRRCIELWEKTLPEGAWPAYTFSNHDVARAISRYEHGADTDKRARLLALLLLTLRGTPFIYYGEEIGMKEARLPKDKLQDPIGRKWYPLHRGRDGCRTPMQWENGPGAGFSTAEPWLPLGPEVEARNVANQVKDPHSMLNFYKQLIRLRKELPALTGGDYQSITASVPEECFCYRRQTDQQSLVVCLNFSAQTQMISLTDAERINLQVSTNPERKENTTGSEIKLEPYEGCLLKVELKGGRPVDES
jgi:alpha-glucosidase